MGQINIVADNVYDADLSAYFDTIPQERLLLDKLARHISDQNCLALIRRWLRAPVQIEQEGKVSQVASTQGTQQGSPYHLYWPICI